MQLNEENLVTAGAELYEKVVASGFHPTVLVGVPSGGRFVAQAILKSHPQLVSVEAEARRPTTNAKKSSGIKKIASRLPTKAQAILRQLELIAITKHLPRERVVVIDEGSSATLLKAESPRLLVVDDTVDTGATLEAVVNRLRELRPDAEIRTAVLAVSMSELNIDVDFVLYKDTLLQGPWSIDAKVKQ